MQKFKFQINEFERALLTLDKTAAEKIILAAVKVGSPVQIASELVTETLQRIGNNWETGKVALSQVYMSGIICEELIDKILPPSSPLRKNQPKMAIAVFEDYHVLGKRIIYSALRAGGVELMDLGSGVTTKQLIKIIKKEKIKILLLSTLMLPSALKIKDLKKQLGDTDIKIIVGGAPFRFDTGLWEEIGADAVGSGPSDALEIIT
ncbi:MAG: cobalamin-dependent protein [bacterium]